jgi:hypothetical protein
MAGRPCVGYVFASEFQRPTPSTPAHIFCACAPQAMKHTPFAPGTCSSPTGASRDVTTRRTAAVNCSQPLLECDAAYQIVSRGSNRTAIGGRVDPTSCARTVSEVLSNRTPCFAHSERSLGGHYQRLPL